MLLALTLCWPDSCGRLCPFAVTSCSFPASSHRHLRVLVCVCVHVCCDCDERICVFLNALDFVLSVCTKHDNIFSHAHVTVAVSTHTHTHTNISHARVGWRTGTQACTSGHTDTLGPEPNIVCSPVVAFQP